MAQGKVTVNNLNLSQGSLPEVERKALFIGTGLTNTNSLIPVNSQTDLDDVLGLSTSNIKTQAKAAQLNGGENWEAWVYPIDEGVNWVSVIDNFIESISPELIMVCNPISDSPSLQNAHALAEYLRTTYAKRVIVLQAVVGLEADGENLWDDYVDDINNLALDINGYRVAAVPLLHGNDLGCLAGRLCNHSVSIADSPMRIKTGPVLGLGPEIVDADGMAISDEQLSMLDEVRLTVIQRYADYPGTFFGSCTLLDAEGGDYQVIENLRIVDKAARAIRLLAIPMIKDRAINTTPVSQAYTKNYLMRPLREMASSTVINGIPFPGEIKPPKDNAIVLVWPSSERLEVYFKLQPYNSPREIVANIMLDLTHSPDLQTSAPETPVLM